MKLTLTDDAGRVLWQVDVPPCPTPMPCPVPMYPPTYFPWWGIYPPTFYIGLPVTLCGNGDNDTMTTHNAPHMAGVTLT